MTDTNATTQPRIVTWRDEPLFARWYGDGRVKLSLAPGYDLGAFQTTAANVIPTDLADLPTDQKSIRDRLNRVRQLQRTPVPPATVPAEATVACLECGATYPAGQAHRVHSGGMGCVRCNP